MANIWAPSASLRPIAEANGSMLRTSKYSDMTLACAGITFRVHRAIVCPRSPTIAAALDGEYQEAQTGRLLVNETPVEALKRFILYMYIDDYDDDGIDESYFATSTELETCSPKEEQNVERPQIKDPAVWTANVPPKSTSKEDKMIRNVRVYALADYYNVPSLRALASQKFEAATSGWDGSGLTRVIQEVFTSTLAHDGTLRAKVVREAAARCQTVTLDGGFMEAASLIPDFMQAFVPEALRVREAALRKEMADSEEQLRREIQQLKSEPNGTRPNASRHGVDIFGTLGRQTSSSNVPDLYTPPRPQGLFGPPPPQPSVFGTRN